MEISLAGWSINRRFRNQEEPLSLLDYPQLARDEFGINAIELNSPVLYLRGSRQSRTKWDFRCVC